MNIKFRNNSSTDTIDNIPLETTHKLRIYDGSNVRGITLLDTNVLIVSNGDIDNEDMVDITDWTDSDGGDGVSSQATFDSKSCMKLDSGTADAANFAKREQDLGSFGARTVFTIKLYLDEIGSTLTNDNLIFVAYNGTKTLGVQFASNGLFVYDNSPAFIEVGTNIVVADTWQEWTLDTDWTNVDVYLDGVYQGSVTPLYVETKTDGKVYFNQAGSGTAHRISYIDWFKAGNRAVKSSPIRLYDGSSVKSLPQVV